MSEDHKPDNP